MQAERRELLWAWSLEVCFRVRIIRGAVFRLWLIWCPVCDRRCEIPDPLPDVVSFISSNPACLFQARCSNRMHVDELSRKTMTITWSIVPAFGHSKIFNSVSKWAIEVFFIWTQATVPHLISIWHKCTKRLHLSVIPADALWNVVLWEAASSKTKHRL